jgi:hypothetical protein
MASASPEHHALTGAAKFMPEQRFLNFSIISEIAGVPNGGNPAA